MKGEGLEVDVEISHAKMLKRVAQVEARLNKLADNAERAFQKSNASAVQGFSRAAANTNKSSKAFSNGLRQTSMQLSQVVQQAQAGTNVFQALAMQLPDLALGLGPVGILLGAIAGGLTTLAVGYFNAEKESKVFEEATKRLDGVLSAVEGSLEQARMSADELIETYGDAALKVRDLIKAEAELRVSRAKTQLSEALPGAAEGFKELSALDRVRDEFEKSVDTMSASARKLQQGLIDTLLVDMTEKLGIGADEAFRLSDAFNEVSSAEGFEQQDAALHKTLATVKELGIPLSALPDPIEDALLRMIDLTQAVYAAEKATKDLAAAAETLPGSIPGVGSTSGIPLYEWGLSGGGLLPPKKVKTTGAGRGSKSRPKDDPARIEESAQREVDRMQRQIELLGQTEAKIAELTTKWRLLDEAKRRGIDLDQEIAGTGQTVRDTIEQEAERVGQLAREYEAAREQQEFFTEAQEAFNEGVLDAIVYGEDLGDVLDDLAKKFAKAALEAALFGSGPLSNLFGTTGGGLFGETGVFSGGSFFNAGGGPARAGQAMSVNERTPNSEIFVPSGNGGVLNVGQAQTALRNAASSANGGGRSDVYLHVPEGVTVEQVRGEAVKVVSDYDAGLPGRVHGIMDDPRSV